MNEGILTACCCFMGDADRALGNSPAYFHHGTHVIFLSPDDSRVIFPEYDCRFAGGVGYIGQVSLDRQIEHLKILLTYPHEFFLLHDSDSICLSPEIPNHAKDFPDTLFSSIVGEPRPHHSPYPKVAFQPPYLLSRYAIERILRVAPRVPAHEITPFIDWAMVAWTCEAGLKWKSFSDFDTGDTRIRDAQLEAACPQGNHVRNNGRVFCHPVKTREHLAGLMKCHADFKNGNYTN